MASNPLLTKAKAAPEPQAVAPTESAEPEAVTAAPETESAWVIDPATDRYVKRDVPVGSIAYGSVSSDPLRIMRTDCYDQEMAYCMVNDNPGNFTYVDARAKGYRPYAPAPGEALQDGHQMRDIPGIGRCVSVGDLIVMAAPRGLKEAHEADYARQRAIERGDIDKRTQDLGEQILDRAFAAAGVRRDKDSYVQREDARGRIRTGYHENIEYVDADDAGDSYAERQLELAGLVQREAQRAGVSFGGFAGNPAFNRGVPESPALRK